VPRILLAEGHAPTRDFVAASLDQAGFEVAAVDDPARAYELYAAERPDVVVLGADGPAGPAARLAAWLRGADPRVLLVVIDREHLGKAFGLPALMQLKPNAYVSDPTRRDLVAKVQQLVAQAGERPRPRGAARVLARAPAFHGEAKPGVVPRLVHQIWRSLSDGILVLEGAGPTRRVSFLGGSPVAARSDDPDESLLRWLAQSGRMDPAAHAAALENMAGGLSPGAALIAAGIAEPGEPLEATLRAHLRAVVIRAVAARADRWRFHAGGEFAGDGPTLQLQPLPLVLEGARLGMVPRSFHDALRAVTEAYPVRSGEFQQLLSALALSSSDLRLALTLDGRLDVKAWLAARPSELKEALSLLWFLSMIGAVEFQEAPAPETPYAAAPRRRRALPLERAEAIRQAALQILPGSYFRALALDFAADSEEVERAYQAVASRFHPDGFAEYDLGDLEDLLAAIQDKLTAAYRVLADGEKRRAYQSFLLGRFELAGARRPGADLDAEIALKRGERALRARHHAAAVGALRQAVERSPKEPEYVAMLAFAELFDPVRAPEARAQEARRLARRAIGLAPDHVRATAALVLAEDALGDIAEARRLALAALRVHPQSEVLKRVLFRVNRVR
jgi:DNA-binding NarL/FixJ family response regulator/tetratricopeptide (TPR) repeat protein